VPSQYQKFKKELSVEDELVVATRPQNRPESSVFSTTSSKRKDPIYAHLKKMELIDDIRDILLLLKEERVDASEYPQLDESMTVAQLETFKHLVTRKLRKLQSTSLIDDGVFMLLKGVESVFDGKTNVFGVSPNLKGLGKSVSLKMRD